MQDKKSPGTDTHATDEYMGRIARELYERNVELSVKNQTLLIQKKIYEIINKTMGLNDMAHHLLFAIVEELDFKIGMICTLEHRPSTLRSIASTEPHIGHSGLAAKARTLFKSYEVRTRDTDNLCVSAVLNKRRHTAESLSEALAPVGDVALLEKIEKELGVVATTIYPLIFGEQAMGVLVLGMSKHFKELSAAEHEALKGISDVVAIALAQARNYTELKKANERLKELDVLKDEFVSIASHELRTPMTAIRSYLWMALHKPEVELKNPLKKYIEISYSSTERLIMLVNDMLTVSRIENNRIELAHESVDIHEIARLVHDELKVTADEKKVQFTLEKDPAVSACVLGDKNKLREVVQNLVGNALKFTSTGGRVAIVTTVADKKVRLSVTDTGNGIAEEDIPKLFKKFSRIDYSYVNHGNQPGTGLGLYITKQIVALHEGDIEVESKVNVGSTFTVVIPQYRNDPTK